MATGIKIDQTLPSVSNALEDMRTDFKAKMENMSDHLMDEFNLKMENTEKDFQERVRMLESRLEYIQFYHEKIEEKHKQEYLVRTNLLREKLMATRKTYRKVMVFSIAMMLMMMGMCLGTIKFMDNMNDKFTALEAEYLELVTDYVGLQEEYNSVVNNVNPQVEIEEPTISSEPDPVVEINTTDITQPSNLTADQLNHIINTQLTKIGHPSTKMSNIGEALVKMENDSGVNALFCLSVGSIESGHGTSAAARNKNNLFGLTGKNGLMTFESVEHCIEYWGNLIRTKYIDSGRTTISEIQQKYCPGSTIWTSHINTFMATYSSHVKS